MTNQFSENKPIYLQLADRIMDEIEREEYLPDSRLPSVREYAAKMGVNPNTMMRAYSWLQDEHIIYNKRGIGYFVYRDADSKIFRKRMNKFLDVEMPAFIKRMILLNVDFNTFDRLYRKYLFMHEGGKF